MRPGTVDYSKWDALVTSSDDEVAPAAPPAPPISTPSPAAPSPPPADSAPEADIGEVAATFSHLLPLLLANDLAMRVGSHTPKAAADDPLLVQLPASYAAALRELTGANDLARGAARLACLCRAARTVATLMLVSTKRELAAKRDYVFRALVAQLKQSADQDERVRAGTSTAPPREPDAYVSSDEDEAYSGILLESVLVGYENLERVLRELTSWTEVPAGVTPPSQVPGMSVQKIADTVLQRDFALAESTAGLQRARRNTERTLHNMYVAEHGGRPAPLLPAPQPQQMSAAQLLLRDGGLIIMTCRSCFVIAEAIQGFNLFSTANV